MSLSDWLAVTLAFFGAFVGIGTSWLFFRTQLITDFHSLREKLIELNVPRDVNAVVNPKLEAVHADVREIKTKIDVIEQFNNSKEIASLKFTIEKLDNNLSSAVSNIIQNVKNQQFELAERIQNEFKSQSISATNIVRDAFSAVSRYFCERFFRSIPAPKIGKNDATAIASGGPDSSSSPRFNPTRG